MPRRENSGGNLLTIQDNLSGCELGLYYRFPETSERQGYFNGMQKRLGKKVVNNAVANRVKYGKKILTGLRDGDFERRDDAGAYIPISTDMGNQAHYFEGWMKWMEDNCADILVALAVRVYEFPVLAAAPQNDGGGGEVEEEDADQD